jgi:hypothetical protein
VPASERRLLERRGWPRVHIAEQSRDRSRRNYNSGAYYSGNIMELMTSKVAYGQSTRDSVRNYINSRYALAI